MRTVPSHGRYTLHKHAEVKPSERALHSDGSATSKPSRRWVTTAMSKADEGSATAIITNALAVNKKDTVFVESAVRRTHVTGDLVRLLSEHVENNLVKVGKKFYRQKTGIPQGSVLSSFLCNYFYADLERKHLGFLDSPDSLLVRLIDDFMLITLDKRKAERFVATMEPGIPDYGVLVNPDKLRANFEVASSQGPVQRPENSSAFPFCGLLIDYKSLEILKDRRKDPSISRCTVSSSMPSDIH